VGSTLVPFIDADEIKSLNQTLGQRISRDYESVVDESAPLILVVTLKGALFFAADLAREITIPIEIDFLRAASYGRGTQSSGLVKIMKNVDVDISGRHVLIIDEIVDSGRTLATLLEQFAKSNPARVNVCSLLSKPSRREVEVPIDYLGREVDDEFLVGYGLDFGEKYRNLPAIYVFRQT
jgi:hypoxanthine phosphoribosyltransferase